MFILGLHRKQISFGHTYDLACNSDLPGSWEATSNTKTFFSGFLPFPSSKTLPYYVWWDWIAVVKPSQCLHMFLSHIQIGMAWNGCVECRPGNNEATHDEQWWRWGTTLINYKQIRKIHLEMLLQLMQVVSCQMSLRGKPSDSEIDSVAGWGPPGFFPRRFGADIDSI